jgi:hypothetical protein
VEGVAARFDTDIHDGAGLPAVFGAGILVGLEFTLVLNRI